MAWIWTFPNWRFWPQNVCLCQRRFISKNKSLSTRLRSVRSRWWICTFRAICFAIATRIWSFCRISRSKRVLRRSTKRVPWNRWNWTTNTPNGSSRSRKSRVIWKNPRIFRVKSSRRYLGKFWANMAAKLPTISVNGICSKNTLNTTQIRSKKRSTKLACWLIKKNTNTRNKKSNFSAKCSKKSLSLSTTKGATKNCLICRKSPSWKKSLKFKNKINLWRKMSCLSTWLVRKALKNAKNWTEKICYRSGKIDWLWSSQISDIGRIWSRYALFSARTKNCSKAS